MSTSFEAFTLNPTALVASRHFASTLMASLLNLNEIRLDVNACIICGLANLFIQTRVRQLRTECNSAAAGTLRTDLKQREPESATVAFAFSLITSE